MCGCCRGVCSSGEAVCCPLHRVDFELDDCHEIALSPDKVMKMEVACWNSPRGCTMVGTLARVLEHFERDCGFHEAVCGRCEARVVQSDIANHLRRGCSAENGERATTIVQVPSGAQGDLATSLEPCPLTLKDVKEAFTELKGMLATSGSNVLSVLETKVNELTENILSLGANISEFAEAEKRARADLKVGAKVQNQNWQKSTGGSHSASLQHSDGRSMASTVAVPLSRGAEGEASGKYLDDSACARRDKRRGASLQAASFITHVETKAAGCGDHYLMLSGWDEFKKKSIGAGDSHVYATCTLWCTDNSWVRVLLFLETMKKNTLQLSTYVKFHCTAKVRPSALSRQVTIMIEHPLKDECKVTGNSLSIVRPLGFDHHSNISSQNYTQLLSVRVEKLEQNGYVADDKILFRLALGLG